MKKSIDINYDDINYVPVLINTYIFSLNFINYR